MKITVNQNFKLSKKKTRILVTGGAGFIGNTLVKNLINAGFKVNCLDIKKPEKIFDNNYKFFKGSIFDKNVVSNAMANCKIVVHLAASLGVENTDKNILNCLNINIIGTKKVLEIALKNKVDRFILTSSSEVYGEQKKFPINETAELKNKSIYATSKIVAEQYVKGFFQASKLKFNIIRFFNVYGHKQEENFVMSKFIKNIKLKKPLTIYGNGRQIRSFCNVEDATIGLIEVIKNGKLNETYNIGNNKEPISILNLAKKIIKISKKNIKIKKISYSKSDRKLSREIFKRFPDLKKIYKHTNYRPKINLENGIKQLLK